MKTMAAILLALFASCVFYSCGDGDTPTQAALKEEVAKGLSLPALTALVKEVRSGQELERKLNQKEGVNNLDLNGDQVTDYIFVSEFGDVKRKIGYSLTAKPTKDEVQEIAEVTIEKNAENAEIQVTGNEQIYGDNAIYNDFTPNKREVPQASSARGSAFPFLAGYFVGRALWSSPWGFGMYPPMYMSFPSIESGKYFSRNKKKYKLSKVRRGKSPYQKYSKVKVRNPNKGKFARKGIGRSLRKPTSTQKQFLKARDKKLKSGGFGRAKSGKSFASRSPSSSARKGFGSRKSGLFSSGTKSGSQKSFNSRKGGFLSGKKSAFGKSQKSFGSRSFRSSSFSSRSFSRGK